MEPAHAPYSPEHDPLIAEIRAVRVLAQRLGYTIWTLYAVAIAMILIFGN